MQLLGEKMATMQRCRPGAELEPYASNVPEATVARERFVLR